MKTVHTILIYLLCCFCTFSCAETPKEIIPLFPCSKKLNNPYGICAHLTQTFWDQPYHDSLIKAMKDARISNVRFDLWLPYSEKLEGNKLLPIIDNAIKKNVNAGLDQLGILFVGWKGQRAWDKKKEYLAFLDTMLFHYRNSIPYWEVMNEINLNGKRDEISADSVLSLYMSLLPMTYKKIKDANPNIVVTSSSISDAPDSFVALMSKKKCYDYFDVLNFHSYDYPENLPIKFQRIAKTMFEDRWQRPVWLTECGYSTFAEPALKFWAKDSLRKEQEQACWIPRTYLISFAYGVDKVYTYSLRAREKDLKKSEDNFGILHADLSPKPAYYAYKTMTKMLPSESLRPTLTKSGNTCLSYWKRPDGKKVWALWNSNGNKKIILDMKGKGRFYDYMGKQLPASKELTIGQGVVYIVGAKNIQIVN